jgi:hypothetical protein
MLRMILIPVTWIRFRRRGKVYRRGKGGFTPQGGIAVGF